jgi:hypothetical protein
MLTIALLSVLVVAGCGGETGGSEGTSAADASRSTPSPTPSVRLTEDLTPIPTAGEVVRQLRGTLSDGVEPGCVLLTAADGLYLLVGGDRSMLTAGGTVVVTGIVRPHLVTTCQQGTPFQVQTIVRA